MTYILQALWLIACAVPAAFIAWQAVALTGLQGVLASIATVILAMLLALTFFALTIALRRTLRRG
jgi:hypothetical protein